jgi:hypothetical protein
MFHGFIVDFSCVHFFLFGKVHFLFLCGTTWTSIFLRQGLSTGYQNIFREAYRRLLRYSSNLSMGSAYLSWILWVLSFCLSFHFRISWTKVSQLNAISYEIYARREAISPLSQRQKTP